ncbi:MAG: blaR [Eubacterium sp.]|jgi:bla regulator protein BlaR1|nr:blaR [Eubacterium sp.]
MDQSDRKITETIKEALDTQMPFDEIWKESRRKESKLRESKSSRKKKLAAFPLIAIITIVACLTVGFAAYKQLNRVVDKTDYPFVDDPAAIGKWKVVDFVKNTTDFTPDKKQWKDALFLSDLAFIKDGKMLTAFENRQLAYASITWTSGKVISEQEKTASAYYIKEISGKTYMFYQWKSGDYVFQGMEPYYYVLEKADSSDYSQYKPAAIEDKIDYPFENNPQMPGSWESIDFVKEIDQFKPDTKSWLDDLYLTNIKIKDNGKLSLTTTKGEYSGDANFWTKDLIISKPDKTASKCTIKEIDGSTYMFYEWKSGDYSYRGMKPYYYVLKKVD